MKRFGFLALLLLLCSYTPDADHWILVLHADTANINNQQLVLQNVVDLIPVLTPEPNRQATGVQVAGVLTAWEEDYTDDMPNAALVYTNSQGLITEETLTLKNAEHDGQNMIFQITGRRGLKSSQNLRQVILFVDHLCCSLSPPQCQFQDKCDQY